MNTTRSARRRKDLQRKPAGRPFGRPTGLGVLAILLTLGIAGAVYALRSVASPPHVDLEAAQAPVRASIQTALAQVADQPDDGEAWGDLGMRYHVHDYVEAALECYERAADLNPGDARWPYLEAMLRESDEPFAAMAEYETAIWLGADHAAAHWRLGELQLSTGLLEPAAESFLAASERDARAADPLIGLARVRLQQERAGEAEFLLERALVQDPNRGDALAAMSEALRMQNRVDEADAYSLSARKALDRESVSLPDPIFAAVVERGMSTKWLNRRARVSLQTGDVQTAQLLFEQSLGIDAAQLDARLGLATARQMLGQIDEAMRDYRRILEDEPTSVEAASNLGLLLLEEGETSEAEVQLLHALETEPDHLESLVNLATLRQDAGRYTDSLDLIERGLAIDPMDTGLLRLRAAAWTAMGRAEEAAGIWRDLIERAPEQPALWQNLASNWIQIGDSARAISALREGLGLLPQSTQLQGMLAWQLATAPDPEARDAAAALEIASRLDRSEPDQAQVLDLLAAAQAASGDYAAAVSSAERALDIAIARGQTELAEAIGIHLEAYRLNRAYVQAEGGS